MKEILKAAPVGIALILVLAVVGLAAYEVVHAPDSDVTKNLTGAITLAFGAAIAHLFRDGKSD